MKNYTYSDYLQDLSEVIKFSPPTDKDISIEVLFVTSTEQARSKIVILLNKHAIWYISGKYMIDTVTCNELILQAVGKNTEVEISNDVIPYLIRNTKKTTH